MSFTVRVDKTKPRQAVLYAENMGRMPPNAAYMIVKAGRKDTELVLQSDFKYCDSLMLTYKEDDYKNWCGERNVCSYHFHMAFHSR